MKPISASDIRIDHTPAHLHLGFNRPRRVLSSAPLNGGLVQADHLLNLRVAKSGEVNETPDETLQRYSRENGWSGLVVGMMTAASMNSCRYAAVTEQAVSIEVLATCGLANARRIGDPADVPQMAVRPLEMGTINLVAMTSARMSDAAMAEALMMVTEAKAAVLQEFGVRSPVSGNLATGTGTDVVAIVSGEGPEEVAWCGKHLLFGEHLGRMVMQALGSSVVRDLELRAAR